MKAISLLGSTGSVGVTTLDVVGRFADRFRVVAMAAGRNLELLVEQVERFRPEVVSVATPELARELTIRLGGQRTSILHGLEGAIAVATHPATELVMSAMVGLANVPIQLITQSSRNTANVDMYATIWFRVSVEMNNPTEMKHPPTRNSPRYAVSSGFTSGRPYRNSSPM